MKWALIFVFNTGLGVEYLADSEDHCRTVGRIMFEQYKVAWMCADMEVELAVEAAKEYFGAPHFLLDTEITVTEQGE